MTEYTAKRDPNRCPAHPGEVIDDILTDIKKSKSEIAEVLGISRQHLHAVLNGDKPVSANVAVRIAKAFGGSAESWLRMQAAYDAWHAEREVDVSTIPTLEAAS